MLAAAYSAAIVTFRRPDSLRTVLAGLQAQDHPPTLVVVADNDPNQSAEPVVAEFARGSGLEVAYLPLGQNIGPAGGWARAAELAAGRPERGSWLAVLDDDDPISHPQVMSRLGELADAAEPDVAAIGLRGARLRRWSATLRRVEATPAGAEAVDYLASGGAPLYRWASIDEVGFFDERLFFGFEDLELGLRLRSRGLRLLVQDLDGIHLVPNTSSVRTEWREYYKSRSLVVISRRHLGTPALLATLLRTLVLSAPRFLIVDRRATLIRARWCGARDGLADRLGPGSHAPTTNPEKKPPIGSG